MYGYEVSELKVLTHRYCYLDLTTASMSPFCLQLVFRAHYKGWSKWLQRVTLDSLAGSVTEHIR